MSDIKALAEHPRFQRIERELESGGGPPHNGDMEARVEALEQSAQETRERLIRIEAKQDEFIKHYATKADLTEAKNSVIMWVVSAILLAQLLPAILKKFGL
ncbi:hypothetical protein LJR099_003071 [Variovorax paradoxus]|uniref:hypothetical protein n=1 Tax=Variovorax paradoxus TaxID=34073 RepID=UPI0039999BF6